MAGAWGQGPRGGHQRLYDTAPNPVNTPGIFARLGQQTGALSFCDAAPGSGRAGRLLRFTAHRPESERRRGGGAWCVVVAGPERNDGGEVTVVQWASLAFNPQCP